MNVNYKVSGDNSKFLEPNGGVAHIDVVNDMPWTLTPKSGRVEVPTAFVREYQQSAGQLVASIIYLTKLGLKGVGGIDFPGVGSAPAPSNAEIYKYKYIAKPTGFSYGFPYFNQKKASRTTQFSTEEEGLNPFKSVTELGKAFASGVNGRTGSGIIGDVFKGFAVIGSAARMGAGIIDASIPGKLNLDLPKEWRGTTEEDFTITFDLHNTGSVEDIVNNRNLCYILTHQNTQSRRNAILTDPVCIYELHIPDVVHFPAASMANLSIANLGNTRSISNLFPGKTKIIPEAYRITMTFKSLLQPSRQILQSEDDGMRVSAITDEQEVLQTINEALKKAAQTALDFVGPPAPTQ
jgi:hypothetical protein